MDKHAVYVHVNLHTTLPYIKSKGHNLTQKVRNINTRKIMVSQLGFISIIINFVCCQLSQVGTSLECYTELLLLLLGFKSLPTHWRSLTIFSSLGICSTNNTTVYHFSLLNISHRPTSSTASNHSWERRFLWPLVYLLLDYLTAQVLKVWGLLVLQCVLTQRC